MFSHDGTTFLNLNLKLGAELSLNALRIIAR